MRRILLGLTAAISLACFTAPAMAWEPRHDRDDHPAPQWRDHRDFDRRDDDRRDFDRRDDGRRDDNRRDFDRRDRDDRR